MTERENGFYLVDLGEGHVIAAQWKTPKPGDAGFEGDHWLVPGEKGPRYDEDFTEIGPRIDREETTRLQAENARLREALEPFVRHLGPWMDRFDDADICTNFAQVTFGDLRRARTALKGPTSYDQG